MQHLRRQRSLFIVCLLGLALTASSLHAQDPAPPAEAPTPAPEADVSTPEAAPASKAAAPDVSALEAELASVLDELIQARTRASVLAKSLFRTRIEVSVVRRADDQQLEHIALKLDGVPVHDSNGASLAQGEAKLFDGYAAPGVHELSIEVTEQAKENATYRYTRVERFRIEIKKNTRTQVQLVLRDDSDMAEELPEGDDGEYDVRTLMRVEATPVKGN